MENWGRCENNQAGSQADKTERGKGIGRGTRDDERRFSSLLPVRILFEKQASTVCQQYHVHLKGKSDCSMGCMLNGRTEKKNTISSGKKKKWNALPPLSFFFNFPL